MKLIHWDCLEYLKQIPDKSVDMILQDPPYNTTACAWEWDIMTKIDEFWKEWNRVIKPNGAIVMFWSEPFSSALRMSNIKQYKYDWIWEKQPTMFQHSKNRPMQWNENISVFSINWWGHKSQMWENRMNYYPQWVKNDVIKKFHWVQWKYIWDRPNQVWKEYMAQTWFPTNIIKIPKEKKTTHPTQKPVALMEYLIKTYTNEWEVVFDGFMWSWTCGVACKNLNRDFIGIELNKEYFEISKNRIESLT